MSNKSGWSEGEVLKAHKRSKNVVVSLKSQSLTLQDRLCGILVLAKVNLRLNVLTLEPLSQHTDTKIDRFVY